MNTLVVPDPSRSIDFGWEVFEHLLTNRGGYQESLNDLFRGFGDNYIISGCVVVGSNCTSGIIMLDGEVLYVEAHTKSGDYFQKVTSDITTYDIKDEDGNNQYILKKERGVLSASSGNLIYNGTRMPVKSLTSAGVTIHKVEIGSWDMTADLEKVVSWPSTIDVSQIASLTVFIANDAHTVYYPLNRAEATGIMSGQIKEFNTTSITLSIRLASLFQTTDFNNTVVNRGYVNIILYSGA